MAGLEPAIREARALRTIVTTDPVALRRRALDALLAVVGCDAALFYRASPDAAGLRVVTYEVRGSRADAVRQATELCRRDPTLLAPTLNLRAPPPLHRSTFLEDQATHVRRAFEESPVFRLVYAPNGIAHHQRLLAYHGRRHVGWIGLVRLVGAKPFRRLHRARLQPLVEPVLAALTQADRLERALVPGEPADFIVDARGVVEYASAAGRAWLAHADFVDGLRALVRSMDVGAPTPSLPALPRVVRLDDGGGRVRYLVHVAPAPDLVLSGAVALSKAQREVAELAAAGATVDDIARVLARGKETVRTHLKHAYRRLGVASRVELARALEEAR